MLFRIMEVSTDSQSSIVFEGSSQDPSNSGIVFSARRSSIDSVGTGSQQRSSQGMTFPLKFCDLQLKLFISALEDWGDFSQILRNL